MEERKENMDAAQEAAHGAEAHTEEGAAAARLGKFKSVDALLNAYNSLEAEFTRRSQRLRELEARAQNNGNAGSGDNAAPPAPRESSAPGTVPERAGGADVPDDVKRSVIEEYLASVSAGAPLVMAGGGTHVSAPERRARTMEEAGALAAHLLQGMG